MGYPGKLLEIYVSIVVKTHLLKNIVGLRRGDKALAHIREIRIGEIFLVNAGSTAIVLLLKNLKVVEMIPFHYFFLFVQKYQKK